MCWANRLPGTSMRVVHVLAQKAGRIGAMVVLWRFACMSNVTRARRAFTAVVGGKVVRAWRDIFRVLA